MAQFGDLLSEITELKNQLSIHGNRLWDLKLSLDREYKKNNDTKSFLIRRLLILKQQQQKCYQNLISHLNQLITLKMPQHLYVVKSPEDRHHIQLIRKKIRYLQNAFASDLPVLNSVIARWSY